MGPLTARAMVSFVWVISRLKAIGVPPPGPFCSQTRIHTTKTSSELPVSTAVRLCARRTGIARYNLELERTAPSPCERFRQWLSVLGIDDSSAAPPLNSAVITDDFVATLRR